MVNDETVSENNRRSSCMRKILITGASGMLGATLANEWKNKYQIYATASSDFTSNPATNFKKFNLNSGNYPSLRRWVDPDVIVHCAAITKHEYCEAHPKEAMSVNGESVKKLIRVFPGVKIIFVSTDAVFPPKTHLAKETSKTGPVTVYGKSKELGEQHIINLTTDGCIVRTTIVGLNINSQRQSFAEWIISSMKSHKPIRLFDNVFFTPISIWHFAKELDWIINNKVPKILHVAGREVVSKYDFGYNLSDELKFNLKLIRKGKLSQKEEIKRSKDQSLNVSYYESISNHRLPGLKDTLKAFIKNIQNYEKSENR